MVTTEGTEASIGGGSGVVFTEVLEVIRVSERVIGLLPCSEMAGSSQGMGSSSLLTLAGWGGDA